MIYDRNIHLLKDFSIYTGFTTNNEISQTSARVISMGHPDIDEIQTVLSGWAVERYETGTSGQYRIDSNVVSNMGAIIANVWDTGHSLFYTWDNANNKMGVYKDWVRITSVSGLNGSTVSDGYVYFPIGDKTMNSVYPLIIGGRLRQFAGSIKTLIIFDHVLSSDEIISLRNCAM